MSHNSERAVAPGPGELPQQDVYIDAPRPDVEPYLPRQGVRRALDVGCGRGGFAATLRAALGPDPYLLGIESVPSQAEYARQHSAFDRVITGYFPQVLDGDQDQTFDLITFNDVLEHIVDPWTTLAATRAHLAPGGKVIAAIPNIRYAPVMWQLARGRWDYTDMGTLDRTHVRFFTRATMIEMFEGVGYRVESCEGANPVYIEWAGGKPPPGVFAPKRRIRRAVATTIGRGASRALGEAAFLHFVVVATPLETP